MTPPVEDLPVSSVPNATVANARPLTDLPPISPRNPNPGGYTHRFVPGTSPSAALQGGPRSRSLSLGNPPLGWSQRRGGCPLSPAMTAGKTVLPRFALPDLTMSLSMPEEEGGPPNVSEIQRAMEAAVRKERERTRTMEKEEENLSAEALKIVLKNERHRMARMAADLASVRSMAVQSVAQAEVHEEGRINNLMRRLDMLQAEKGRIIVELEREEEMLTNTLQKKLNAVLREKELLEKQQMSRSDLEARLAALQSGAGDVNMSEELEEKEEMEDDE